ncbi:hypothetical protein [Flavobacterium sp.]|uniref:hypothetical protein n=1 Tax=Flavobacterium sp. TaxID=239 RepID=UPI00261282EC|nr:hypothetical protein [Flavobacterium sp.]
MRKLTHSKFELDLSNFKISDTDENSWFSDSFFTRYSFPFDIDLEDDLNKALDFIDHHNSNPETYYEVMYTHNNFISKAIFEVEQLQQKLTCTVRFGFESLPSFGKKLADLSLDKFVLPVGTNIYQHANLIVNQSWPDVNYNFPQVHTDKYNTEDPQWNAFEKIINNRKDGDFLQNEVNEIEEATYNRNIMQPLPYFLHILQRGFIDDGYVLAGQILDDDLIKKATLFGDVDYFTTIQNESIFIYKMVEDFTATGTIVSQGTFKLEVPFVFTGSTQYDFVVNPTIQTKQFLFSQNLPNKGKYRISGQFSYVRNAFIDTYFRIKYRDIIIFEFKRNKQFYQNEFDVVFRGTIRNQPIDITFETLADLNADELTFDIYGSDTWITETNMLDISIDMIYLNDQSGNPQSTIINRNEVDLKRAVPDMLFDDFVKGIKNWFNYDITKVIGNTIYMDRIEDSVNHNDALDFSMFEVKYPVRKYSKGNSFLLKFSDVESKEFTYLPVYQNQNSVESANFKIDDKTTPIEINALPLPHTSRNGVQTAFAFENNNSKMYLVPYDGLVNSNNYSLPINDYLIPAVHKKYWEKWFDFRINSVNYIWSFKCYVDKLNDLTTKSKIRAYENTHILKLVNKTEYAPDQFDVEFDSYTVRV